MKKQLFIALLASTVMVSSISMTAFAATNTTTNIADKATTNSVAVATTNSAVTTTNTGITTTGTAVATTNGAVTTTTAAVTTTDSAITGTGINVEAPETVAPIKLSLEAAYKKMLADSPDATLAKWTRDSELSIARGNSESVSRINKDGGDTTNKAKLQTSRDFGNKQAPKNYESSLNKLKQQTYDKYYNYKYTEVQVQVGKDNLDRTQAIYDSTMLKYKLGTVSKLDTLTAQTSLNTAKDNYTLAVNSFEQIKMNFNLFMGYNLHQKVTLTDSLASLALPSKSLDDSIKEALVNRNEISGANYSVQLAQYDLNNVKAYPKNSATYLSANSSLLIAQENAKTAPAKVEIDVRTKHMDMMQKYDAVNSGKISYENSKETSRLGQLQYDSGIITLTDLSKINSDTFSTQQAYFKAILDYNLSVEDYNLASGIGTESAAIR